NTQKAVYAALSSALDAEVYDFVPEDAELPYVTIGSIGLKHNTAVSRSTYEIDMTLHAYDRSNGRKNLLALGDTIFNWLNGMPLTIEDFTHYETMLLTQNIGLDGDADRYALDASYRIIVG